MRPTLLIIGTLVVLSGLGGSYLLFASETSNKAEEVSIDLPYIELVAPSGFVNTESITIGEQVGKKVVLVEFMTYSCINCQRTFPHVNAWYEKYRDEGLEIIGVHTPEFAFEKDMNNVREALGAAGIQFPVALDNEYKTWNAYGNRYWPRKYLIGIDGKVAYDHIGEGSYEETEAKIRELLMARAERLGVEPGADTRAGVNAEVENYAIRAQSPEIYFGAHRNTLLGNGKQEQSGVQQFVVPANVLSNVLYLGGAWDIREEYATGGTKETVVFRYRAAKVHMVASADESVRVTVIVDGIPRQEVDVDAETLYTLVDDTVPGDHILELQFDGPVKVYTFTFG